MKKILLCLLLGISLSGFSQQTVVTVPVAEIVKKEKVYDGPGMSINKNLVQLSNILTYGFGNNWQGGITLIDLSFNYGPEETFFPIESLKPGMNPDLLINLQKGWKINKNTWIALGTQSGANIATEATRFSTFNYLNAQTNFLRDNMIVAGVYHANDTRLVTEEPKWGFMAGTQIPLSSKWIFFADYISGDHARSYINTGISYKINKKWSIYAGPRFPAPESGNKTAAVFQLSYLAK